MKMSQSPLPLRERTKVRGEVKNKKNQNQMKNHLNSSPLAGEDKGEGSLKKFISLSPLPLRERVG
jgi:hypothetical protein